MDTQNLKAFQAVAEHRSFSLAANELYLTQPAISKRIATLEAQLKCKLFDRIGRSIDLTPAGLALLPRARQILLDVSDTQQLISDLSGAVQGHLNLATSHHIGLHRLPPVLRQFTQHYPAAQLSLDFLDSEKAYKQVLQGNYDLAVITLAPEAVPQIKTLKLWKDELCLVASPDHPLSQKKRLTLDDLSAYPAIMPDLSTYTTQLVKGLFDAENLPLDITMATNHMDTIKMMSAIGLGWAVLPRSIVDKQLSLLKVRGVKLSRELGCIYHAERTLSNAANTFLSLLQNASHI